MLRVRIVILKVHLSWDDKEFLILVSSSLIGILYRTGDRFAVSLRRGNNTREKEEHQAAKVEEIKTVIILVTPVLILIQWYHPVSPSFLSHPTTQ